MSGDTPATNARFKDEGGGMISELLSDQTQLFYDPPTGAARAIFNSLPFLNVGNTIRALNTSYDMLHVDFSTRMTTCYAANQPTPILDPVTGFDLANVSNAGVMTLVKLAFDAEINARAMAGPPVAGYTVAAGGGLTAAFTDTSTPPFRGVIESWAWNFGDGVPAAGDTPAVPTGLSTDQNPVYTFPAGGTYNVQLEVTASNGVMAAITYAVTVVAPVPAPAPEPTPAPAPTPTP